MVQKIKLANDGIVTGHRMRPYISGGAKHTPAVKFNRLQTLLKTKEPHICVVRGEGLGDVLTTTPIIRALKKSFGSVKISYATNTRYLEGALVKVLQYNPDICEILERELLDDYKYDLVVNLHCPAIHFEKAGRPPINRIDIFARHAGVELDSRDLFYYIQRDEIEAGEDLVRHFQGKKIILVQPFPSTERRSLDHGKLRDALSILTTQCGAVCLVLTHPTDFRTDVLWDNIPGCRTVRNLDIRQIAGLMVHCDLVLCPDSSVMHLAGALKVPTVALFGQTHPAARINYYPNATAIWRGEDFAPCPCVVGDSLILTSAGYKEIQYLEPGDMVKTVDSRWNRITKIHHNPRKERKLYDLEYFGSSEPITITEDHKMLVVRHKNRQFRKSRFVTNREWVPAKDITDRDFLCIPRNRHYIDGIIEPDPSTCWILGMYMAEGHLRPDRKSVVFTVGSHETGIIDSLKAYGERRQATVGTYPSKRDGSTRVEIYSQTLLNEVRSWFGRSPAKEKVLPNFLWQASDVAIQGFIAGYQSGDGYMSRRKEIILSTASRDIAYGIQELFTRQGRLARIYREERDTNYKKDSVIYRVHIPDLLQKRCRHIVDKDYIYVPVKSIRISERTDDVVYDITVENNTTFCIQNLSAWDCWWGSCAIGQACWAAISVGDVVLACEERLQNSSRVDISQLIKGSSVTIDTEII